MGLCSVGGSQWRCNALVRILNVASILGPYQGTIGSILHAVYRSHGKYSVMGPILKLVGSPLPLGISRSRFPIPLKLGSEGEDSN